MILTTITGYGQRKIKILEVKEEGFNIRMNFQTIVDEIEYKGLSIKIIPISADKLNTVFFNESVFNGKFEYSHYDRSRNSYFLKKTKRKREKSDSEFLLEGTLWLLDNEKINQQEYDELVKQIIYNYDEVAGEKLYGSNKIITSNPYYVKNKYLNVFKIKISNPTSSHITFNANIALESGNTILNPLSSDILIEELERSNLMNLNKSLILKRYNLSKETLIPPKSEVEKLFAVLPLDFNNQTLKASLKGAEKKFSWDVIKNEKKIDESYTFYEFAIDWCYEDVVSSDGLNISILKSNASSVFLGDNELYIGEESLSDTFEIITISLYGDVLFYSIASLKGDYFIEKEKNRRKIISIKNKMIIELKKKVKQ